MGFFMSTDAWFTVTILLLVIIALIRDWGPADAVLMGGSLLCGILGIISPELVFSGFVNQGTLTIGALFIVAEAMRETGVLDNIGRWLFGRAKDERGGLIRLMPPVAGLSAFFNNTPIVAMLLPIVDDWCRKHNISPSRILMPLSFIAILGGTCTLIGTSTNLAIDGLMKDTVRAQPELAESLRPVLLFEMAWVGLPFAVLGGVYLILIAPRLLPIRHDMIEQIEAAPREYLADMKIEPECRLIGQDLEEADLRNLAGLFLAEITRGKNTISPVPPETVMQEGDILTFAGLVSSMVDLERIQGLVPVADENYEVSALERRSKLLCEAVISTRSPLIGQSIKNADFRSAYNSAIIAVHRGGGRIRGRIGDIVLRAGDTLLLQTGPRFARVHHNNPDFYLVSKIQGARAVRHEKLPTALFLMVSLVILMAIPQVPVVYAAFVVAGLLVATRCIGAADARESIDWPTLFTIGASFGIGHALDKSGAALAIADQFVNMVGGLGPRTVLLGVYLLTSIFAAVVSSKASAVLMFPVALAIALGMEVDPRPFILATMFAAASSFSTPLGYPTNLMVYGPGGYKFADFARVGLPLNVLLMFVAVWLIPIVWPF
jgi:di/tricarboxylate transporter